MTPQHDERIADYLRKFPDVKTSHVAKIFCVSEAHVRYVRRKGGLEGTRRREAVARKMTCTELDRRILAAVYKRELVDAVLTK